LSALFALNNAIMLTENDISLKKNRLYCLSQLGENAKCIAQAKELVLLDKSDAQSWRMLCAAYAKSGDYKNALAAIKSLQTLNLTNADDYSVMGDLYFNLQMYSFAVDAYKKAGKAVDPERLGRISLLLAKAGEYEIALKIAPDTFLGNAAKGIAIVARAYIQMPKNLLNVRFCRRQSQPPKLCAKWAMFYTPKRNILRPNIIIRRRPPTKPFIKAQLQCLQKLPLRPATIKRRCSF
ncbi:MAG: hypothetical protein SPI34_03045, partial [Opitutales bacterium]|nr:hypothetical protein [Opitutales bacterium]